MKSHWQPSKKLLGGFKCIENTITKELSLFGKYGELWQYDASTYRAIIYSHRISRRFFLKDRWPIHLADETLIWVPAKDLAVWMRRLAVPAKPSTQAALANRPRSTTEESNGNILSLKDYNHAEISDEACPTPSMRSFGLDPGSENPGGVATDLKTLEKLRGDS